MDSKDCVIYIFQPYGSFPDTCARLGDLLAEAKRPVPPGLTISAVIREA